MKIIYCIHSVYNPGGMERVLLNKVSYLENNYGYQIKIITTDQKGRPPFYPFSNQIEFIDLNVNYSDDNNKNILKKVTGYLNKRRMHKKRLSKILFNEKADIVVSLYPSESSFLCDINDGSKKVLELHYCKFFRLQYGRLGLMGLIDKYRTKQDEKIVRRFDKFVVLSNEDKEYWGDIPNIEVIHNAALNKGKGISDVKSKRVIAVGRLDYQKGFDRLLKAWAIVQNNENFKEWKLDIFGQGEWHDILENMIVELKIDNSARICKPTNNIFEEYVNSSMLVMSSNYEGFPMVMIEAMSCGVPVVSFDFKCGPKDIIKHGCNGMIVKDGDIDALANAMMLVMENDDLRSKMSLNAINVINDYSEQNIMSKWISLFDNLVKK